MIGNWRLAGSPARAEVGRWADILVVHCVAVHMRRRRRSERVRLSGSGYYGSASSGSLSWCLSGWCRSAVSSLEGGLLLAKLSWHWVFSLSRCFVVVGWLALRDTMATANNKRQVLPCEEADVSERYVCCRALFLIRQTPSQWPLFCVACEEQQLRVRSYEK